jgi:hypothetical protein
MVEERVSDILGLMGLEGALGRVGILGTEREVSSSSAIKQDGVDELGDPKVYSEGCSENDPTDEVGVFSSVEYWRM